jgi:hypothetical protein
VEAVMERDDREAGAADAPGIRTNETTIRVSGPAGGPAPSGGPAGETEVERIARERATPGSVRAEDTEPYVGLQYIARLFKIVSFLVLIALALEIVQGGVLAAILWGSADVVLLLIDLGHDVRASRVLLGRVSARGEQQYGGQRQRERER